MDMQQFNLLFSTFEKSAFRLQNFPSYSSVEGLKEYERFAAGELFPMRNDLAMENTIKEAVKSGKKMSRVQILPEILTPYLKFEIEWRYPFSVDAGEEVKFLLPRKCENLELLSNKDFWLLDDKVLVWMNYNADGHFEGIVEGTVDETPLAVQYKNLLLAEAVNLKEYLVHYRMS